MLDILLFIFFGIGLGIFTGLAPGIHVNTVSILLASLAGYSNPLLLSIAIVSMAITHAFFDFIPSIFLGAPDPETALSILPGHKLLLAGRGYEAVYLTAAGGLTAIIAAVLLSPAFILLIPPMYAAIRPNIAAVLIAVASVMIIPEKGWGKLAASLIFMASGLLGLVQFRLPLLPDESMLFVTFTGLFGMSTLLLSLRSSSFIPKQTLKTSPLGKRFISSATLKGLFSGSLLGTLPGMGAAEAAVLAQQLSFRSFLSKLSKRLSGKFIMQRIDSDREFLMTIGGINVAVALFSILSLHTIGRARSGAAVAVDRLIGQVSPETLLLLIGSAAIAAGIAFLLTITLTSSVANRLARINYKKLTVFTIALLISLTWLLAGPLGFIILFASTSIGLLAPLFGVKRSNCMGILMLPLILFYLGI